MSAGVSMVQAISAPLRVAANAVVSFALRSRGGTFADSVLQSIARARRQSVSQPTIDFSRFPAGQRPYGPFAALIVSRFIRKNFEAVNQTAALYADEHSRNLLRQILTFRAVGPYRLRLPTRAKFEQDIARAMEARVGESNIQSYPSGVYDIDFRGASITAECNLMNVVQGVFGHQYYFRRGNVAVEVQPGDTVIDAGGCYGDTALIMASSVGAAGKIYSFEPVPDNIEIFEGNLARNSDLGERITIVQKAVGAQSGKMIRFDRKGGGSHEARGGDVEVQTLTIDDFVEREGVSKVDFIKMDIEGAEGPALDGASATIRRFRPKLGISIYHSLRDLIFLPQRVAQIEPSYRLYLDHHTVHAEETILYAAADWN